MNEFVDLGNPFPSFPFPWYHACFCAANYIYFNRKIHKNCCHQSCSFWLKYAPNRLSAGFAPDPLGGAYSAPPDPLAVFRGPTSLGGGGRDGREGKIGEGRGRKERRREERGGEGGSLSFAVGRKRKVGASAR